MTLQIDDYKSFLKDYYSDKERPIESERITRTKIKLLLALNECIGQQGIGTLPSVNRLCTQAHCSRTSFYLAYTNVAEMVETELDIYLHVLKNLITYLVQKDDEHLRQTLRLCIKRVLLTPQLVFFCFTQYRLLDSKIPMILASMIGSDDKRIRQCQAILAGLLQIQFSVLQMDNQMSNKEIIDYLEGICYDYLLREPFFFESSVEDCVTSTPTSL